MENKFVVITPAKNEEDNIGNILDSMVKQTIKPTEWVIVDDNSTDNTYNIVCEFIKNHKWIKVLKIPNEYLPAAKSRIIRAFYWGYESLNTQNYMFVTKLDADLSLPEDYFEKIMIEFSKDNEIGLCGGVCAYDINGKITIEKTADYHLRGAIKTYRKKCFDQIGGLRLEYGWDGIDEFESLYRNWKIKILNDLVVIHHRTTGKNTGQLKYSFKTGELSYCLGYDPFLALLRAIKRGWLTPPYILTGIITYAGYLIAFIKKSERKVGVEVRKFIRDFQYLRIKRKLLKMVLFLN